MRPHRKTRQPNLTQRIVQKHLIHDQGQPMPQADLLQPHPLRGTGSMSRRIIRMHHHNRLRPWPNPPLQLRKIDPPPIVVKERISPQTHILQIRQKIKQRITRLRDQHLIPRIAQQPKQIPISFTRTRSQHHSIRINPNPTIPVVPNHRFPRRSHPPRIGIIDQRPRTSQRRKNRLSIILKPTNRRVRDRQINQPPPRRPSLANRSRKTALPHIPTRPHRKPITHLNMLSPRAAQKPNTDDTDDTDKDG